MPRHPSQLLCSSSPFNPNRRTQIDPACELFVIYFFDPIVLTRHHFPSDEPTIKLLYWELKDTAEEWKRRLRERVGAIIEFAVAFGQQFLSR